jgi:DNA-binding MarR family transcriptional regulator
MTGQSDTSLLTAHLGYWLRMVSNHVSHQFNLKVEAHGVTVAEWVVMRELLRLGTVNPSRVADGLGMTRGAISKLIERLVTKRLVRRAAAGGGDRRFQSVALTSAGANLVPVLAGLADQNDDESFGFLSARRRADLMATLQEIARRRDLKVSPVD